MADTAPTSEAQAVEAVMVAFSSATDNISMHEAEASLRAFLTSKGSSMTLLTVLRDASAEVARQMAGIFIRRRIIEMWLKLEDADQATLQAGLLERLGVEESRAVRKVIISCVASLGRVALPMNKWPEVMDLLGFAMHQPTEEVRELGVILLEELAEALQHDIILYAEQAHAALGIGLTDPSDRVRLASLRACSLIFPYVSETSVEKHFAELVPPMMEVVDWVLAGARAPTTTTEGKGNANGSAKSAPRRTGILDEGAVILAFEALGELVQVRSKMVMPHLEGVASAALEVLANIDLDLRTRTAASQVIHNAMRQKSATLVKKGFLGALLPIIFDLLTEYDQEEEEEHVAEARKARISIMDHVEESMWAVGSRLLDEVAGCVSERVVFPVVMEHASAWIESSDWLQRRAAVMAVGVIAEGCAGIMQEHLTEVLDLLLARMADTEPPVRKAVAHALMHATEQLLPRVSLYHATVMPAVLTMLADPSPNVIEDACLVLQPFCENIDEATFAQYVGPLMDALGSLISRTDVPVTLQEEVVSAAGSVAVAAKSGFVPYLNGVAETLLQAMQATTDELLPLRCRATVAVGQIAFATGVEAFEPYFEQAFSAASASAMFEDAELSEAFFRFIIHMGQVYGTRPEFLAQVDGIVGFAFEQLQAKEGVATALHQRDDGLERALKNVNEEEEESDDEEGDDDDDEGAEDGAGGSSSSASGWAIESGTSGPARGGGKTGWRSGGADDEDDEGDDEEEEEDEDDDDDDVPYDGEDIAGAIGEGEPEVVRFKINTSMMDLKKAAIDCLSTLLGNSAPAMTKYLRRITRFLTVFCDHFHDDVAIAAVNALINLARAYAVLYPPLEVEGGGVPELHPDMAQEYNLLVTQVLKLIRENPDRETVSYCCSTLGEWANSFGYAGVASHGVAMVSALTLILQEKTVCQLNDDGEDEQSGWAKTTVRVPVASAAAGGGAAGAADAAAAADGEGGGLDDLEDHTFVLMDECTDALVNIAKAWGPAEFTKQLAPIMREILRFAKPSRSYTDRLMALGFCGDLTVALGPDGMAAYVTQVMKKAIEALKGSKTAGNVLIHRNAAFCGGVLVENCPTAAGPLVPSFLAALLPVLQTPRGDPEGDPTIDNACGSVCRILLTMPTVISLADIAPPLLAALPSVSDRAEDIPIYRALLFLLTARHESTVARRLYPRILELVVDALAAGSPVKPEVQHNISSGLQAFYAELSAASDPEAEAERGAVAAALGALSPEQHAILMQCVGAAS